MELLENLADGAAIILEAATEDELLNKCIAHVEEKMPSATISALMYDGFELCHQEPRLVVEAMLQDVSKDLGVKFVIKPREKLE